jgi:drug/metabolite transporter (DMT)-like permease
MAAVLIGFGGIALIALPSINHGTAADAKGILLLIAALLSYAVAINVARPLQAIYSPANLMLYVEIVAFTMSAPYGFWGISQSEFNLGSLGALAILGVLGTGFAFVLFALLNQRAGTARSMIPTYFTPVVGAILGTAFNSEPLLALSVVGMLIVIFGAWLTSKPEVPKIISTTPAQ